MELVGGNQLGLLGSEASPRSRMTTSSPRLHSIRRISPGSDCHKLKVTVGPGKGLDLNARDKG